MGANEKTPKVNFKPMKRPQLCREFQYKFYHAILRQILRQILISIRNKFHNMEIIENERWYTFSVREIIHVLHLKMNNVR